MKINDETIQEFLNLTSQWPLVRQLEFWQIVRDILPSIDLAATAAGEAVCVELVRTRFDKRTFSESIVHQVVQELQNYMAEGRAEVVKTCLTEIDRVATADSDLHVMARRVAEAYGQLDPRAKALIEVLRELFSIDGDVNTDFYNDITGLVEETADVNVLRNDPSLAVIVKAYDIAKAINSVSR